ncbi:MAG: hypothetical protein GY832_23810 [Chloroflexi bacterium]|nr:hypothetical protein [Chloroflexota bacterium]
MSDKGQLSRDDMEAMMESLAAPCQDGEPIYIENDGSARWKQYLAWLASQVDDTDRG